MLARIELHPGLRQLRQFGFIAVIAFGLLGAVVIWRGGLLGFDFGARATTVSYGLWSVGLLSGLFSVVAPRLNQPLFVTLSVVAFPIGWVVSHAVLAFLFFGLLTPVAFVFRLIGRDPLERRFEKDRASYWNDLPRAGSMKDYFRQF